MIASVVAAGSHMVDEARMRDLLSESDIVIAADGGMDALERIGSVPDYVIGDFDSLRGNRQDHSRDFDPTIEVIEYPTRKSMTDMELSLELALEKGATKAYVFGGLGTRIDHSFINVMMLIPFYERGLAITVIDDTNEICYSSFRWKGLTTHWTTSMSHSARLWRFRITWSGLMRSSRFTKVQFFAFSRETSIHQNSDDIGESKDTRIHTKKRAQGLFFVAD